MMHQPVRPIKPGVVQQDRQTDARPPPAPAVFADPEVHLRPAALAGENGQDADEAEDDQRDERVADFASDISALREFLDDLAMQPAFVEKDVSQSPGHAGKEQVTPGGGDRDAGDDFEKTKRPQH